MPKQYRGVFQSAQPIASVDPPSTKPKKKGGPKPKKPPFKPLPPWKVLLHNDNKNDRLYVIKTIVRLTPLKEEQAVKCVEETEKHKVGLILTTHKEHAELYRDQFKSKNIDVTIELA